MEQLGMPCVKQGNRFLLFYAVAHTACTEVAVVMALLITLCNSVDCHDIDDWCPFSFTSHMIPVNPHFEDYQKGNQ